MSSRRLRVVSSAFALAALCGSAVAQLTDLQPGRNFTAVSAFGADRTENIDAGDADNDGDLDVITGNGGDGADQQARIFINAGTGTFTDQTGTRFAGFPNQGARDIEFMDIDEDGDLDVYVGNHTNGGASAGQISRFLVNKGGLQLGPVGFYQDETATRWGALASVPAGDQACGGCNSGPWRDWTCDCDFADLDDDGHIDLFHSSYGPGINGNRDSRVFINDGAGVFNEHFPWINAGADLQTHTIDVDLADFDGDFDIDVFMSSRNSQARVYLNNTYGPLGSALFQDVTQTSLIDTGAFSGGIGANYEAEYGDVDGDGDFDVWAKNYDGVIDRILRNDGLGHGVFLFSKQSAWIVGDPQFDENEIDFGDFDNDGDLDSFVANFSGTNWLYQNGLAQGLNPDTQGLFHRTGGGGTLADAFPELPSNFNGGTSLDGEFADLDNDGDLEILLANDGGQGNWMFRNVLGVPDTHAPGFYKVTTQGDKPNGSDTVIHAAIRDNGPGEWLTNYFDWQLVYTVDGGAPNSIDMLGQFASQARGVIPAQTDATIAYHVEVTDLAGNTGISSTTTFVQGNIAWTDLGQALAGVNGLPLLAGTGSLAPLSAGTLALSNAAPSAFSTLFVSLNTSTPSPFKCGTLVPVPVTTSLPLFTNGSGQVNLGWAAWPPALSGSSLYFQYAIQDGAAICGVALSNALRGDSP
ncbi:MAG TPA: VCBS repeat-containing protein [Planctomycetota bacterium]|nr:VCBS repeat-containing protein [Planctomycetota bacterium]